MKRMIVLVILAVLAVGALAVFTPSTTAGGPCRVCKPQICGPCEVYTGDTCLSCGTCERIHGCHP